MIGYVTIGTHDMERASKFYDGVLAELGAKRVGPGGRMQLWGNGPGKPLLAVCTPWDEKEPTVGNGVMIALDAGSREAVDRIYAKAIELGATDEGPAGPRGDGSFYGGYFRDPDGNKLVAFVMGG